MYQEIKKIVWEANLALPKYGLVTFTWGNVSQIDRNLGIIAIKPSGVAYDLLQVEDIVIVDLDGNIIEGKLKPSSDLMTHVHLYQAFKDIGAVVHTHSTWATSYAQAGLDLMALGTTHADTFYGSVPCTRALSDEEIKEQYELNTGKVIAETFKSLHYQQIPACLVRNHGPFVWGKDAEDAVHNAVVLEMVARMNAITHSLSVESQHSVSQSLLDKHYLRKHGKDATYGQK